jgi:fumarylpyruvate hydrolase
MDMVIPAQERPVIPVVGIDQGFPVHRVFCIGKNYADHVREMGGDPTKQAPIFFLKNVDGVIPGGGRLPYPPGTANYHYEGELVVAIGKEGRDIDAAVALDHVYGYCAGIDFTRRDLQPAAKDKGLPWDMAKSFDASAPVGDIRPVTQIGHPTKGNILLSVNGETRQDGDLSQMVFSVADAIAELSKLITLKAGDLLFTGTPAGVGAVSRGDKLVCQVVGLGSVEVELY